MKKSQRIIAITGTTGSGKTALAVALCKKYDGIIISADSRQIYKELNAGTNKEGLAQKFMGYPARNIDGVFQLAVDEVLAGSRYTLHDWLKLVYEIIEKAKEWGKNVYVVGGTGLYLTALIDGYELPTEDKKIRLDAEKYDDETLRKMIKNIPAGDLHNRRRLTRALEKQILGGASAKKISETEFVLLYLDKPREELYDKSNKRIEKIFDKVVEECRNLIKKRVSLTWLKNIGLDYKFAVLYLQKELSRQEAIEQLQAASRQFIRRQQTWWRHHNTDIQKAVTDIKNAEKILN